MIPCERWLICNYVNRYTILAPNAVPKGFSEAKTVTTKILDAIELEETQFKIGHTKARLFLRSHEVLSYT